MLWSQTGFSARACARGFQSSMSREKRHHLPIYPLNLGIFVRWDFFFVIFHTTPDTLEKQGATSADLGFSSNFLYHNPPTRFDYHNIHPGGSNIAVLLAKMNAGARTALHIHRPGGVFSRLSFSEYDLAVTNGMTPR